MELLMVARLAFFASHNGSSARAITQACKEGRLNAEPVMMISNNPGSVALQWAGEFGLHALIINAKTHGDVDAAIARALRDHKIDVVCCSGYMKLIGAQTIASVDTILNVHPALLPAHGGQGMYGHYIHEAVFAAREKKTGITIHKVDGEYDRGDIVAQKIIPLDDADTAAIIEDKVKAAEADFYIETLAAWLST